MTRRATILGLLFLSQLTVGCCWVPYRQACRMRRCAPACEGGGVPAYSVPLSGPSAGPTFVPQGGPGCTSCATPLAPPPNLVGLAPVPVFGPGPGAFPPAAPSPFGVPQPLGGPTVEPNTAPKH
jgi:hypothetical protein